MKRSTIYDIIARIDNGLGLERKPGSGANNAIPQKIKDKIIEKNVNEIGRSYRSIGKEHNISNHSAKKILTDGVMKKNQN